MTFALENDVRNECFGYDLEEFPPDRIAESLEKAHQEILRDTVLTDETSATSDIVRAEAILALSHLFRSMAVSSAVSLQVWKSHGIHIDARTRLDRLLELSDRLWREGWSLLRPYTPAVPCPPVRLAPGGST